MQSERMSSNTAIFLGILFFVIAWWFAPVEGERHDGNVIAATLFAIVGLGLIIQGARSTVWQPSPFRSMMGRFLWALRPRGWLIAWAVVLGVLWIYGKPHVLYTYPKNGAGMCVYLSWDGARKVPAPGGERFGGCSLVRLI